MVRALPGEHPPPHGLQKKYPDVAFIGVSIWEQDQNAVKPFVDTMGDQMAYRVAIDAIPERATQTTALWTRRG